MYEDSYRWPFKCPKCNEEFTEELGRFKANGFAVRCPAVTLPGPINCPITIRYDAKEFGLMISEAEQGLFDPWRGMARLSERP